jgi:hypothetical protein
MARSATVAVPTAATGVCGQALAVCPSTRLVMKSGPNGSTVPPVSAPPIRPAPERPRAECPAHFWS